MKRHLICSAAILVFSGLSACAHPDGAAGTHAIDPANTTLNAYHWTMNRAVDASGDRDQQWVYQGDANTSATLTFDKQRVAITGLCNTMGANYSVDGSALTINHVVSTMKMCPDETLMRYEQAFGQRLPDVVAWNITRMHDEPIDEPSLTLRFEDGAQWVLTGQPTAETKYGSTGEIMFLEVAANKVACTHPLIPDHQCLHVRTVNYDATGIKQGHGPWENFYSNIDNYEHTEGVRNVLRVKRYTREPVPADASRYAYVLDMVVESDASGR